MSHKLLSMQGIPVNVCWIITCQTFKHSQVSPNRIEEVGDRQGVSIVASKYTDVLIRNIIEIISEIVKVPERLTQGPFGVIFYYVALKPITGD
jgi:hypothetical protein